jgi:DNA-binding IclR family transcriptional regulator
MSEPKHPVQTLNRALDIIEIIQEEEGAGVSEIADKVDLGKSAVHNHLSTLVDRNYLTKKDKKYFVGLGFLGLGECARKRERLYEISKDKIDDLASGTGQAANLLVEVDGMGIYLYQSRGENAVELNSYAGMEVHLHATSLGKAILAFRPEEEVNRIIERYGLPEITEETITSKDKLFQSLEDIRENKYAFDQEERIPGLCCVASPILNRQERSIGAVSISCPVHQVSQERLHQDFPQTILKTANVIELEYNNR